MNRQHSGEKKLDDASRIVYAIVQPILAHATKKVQKKSAENE